LTVDGPPLDQRELLAFEKESIGLYLSAHPLNNIIKSRLPDEYTEIVRLADLANGQPARVIASIKNVRRIPTRQNKTMAAVEIEDLTDRIEIVLFPTTYEEFGNMLEPDTIIEVAGRIDRRNDQLQIIVESMTNEIVPFEPEPPSRRIVLVLPKSDDYWQDVELLQRIDTVLSEHDGRDRIEFELLVDGKAVRVANRKHRVDWDEALKSELAAVLGSERIRVSEPIAS
jgi:DNA polymerase-3 subunit alpha